MDNIPLRCFYGCDWLTSYEIPQGVKLIHSNAFRNCGSLTKIIIPNSVEGINNSFGSCWQLTDITFKGTKEQWHDIDKNIFWDNDTGNYTVHCTNGDLSKEDSY